MSKRLKALVAKELAGEFSQLDRCVIVGLTGVGAIQADGIRAGLQAKNIRLQVVKNTLATVAFKETGLAGVEEYLDGPSAVVSGGGDVVELAKAAAELAKAADGINVRGGFGEGKLLSPNEVDTLSKIPGRRELLGSLAFAMASTMCNFASALGAVQRKFLYGLTALKDGKARDAA